MSLVARRAAIIRVDPAYRLSVRTAAASLGAFPPRLVSRILLNKGEMTSPCGVPRGIEPLTLCLVARLQHLLNELQQDDDPRARGLHQDCRDAISTCRRAISFS